MPFGAREAMVAVAMLFVLFLVAKMRPSLAVRGALGAEVRAARARAYAATNPRARSEALCEAGRLAASGRRWTAAAGFFLRAMTAEPTSADTVSQTAIALSPRGRLLEKILWRRLAHLPWDDTHAAAARAAAVALAGLYQGKLRDRARAEVLRRLAERLG
jgi:hypothetical protein